MITVLRLGHRRGRDDRISTHVGLVARAFGADRIIFSGERDKNILESLRDVVDRWGGPFEVSYNESWKKVIKDFSGVKLHLTMYGLPYQDKITEISQEIEETDEDLLLIVGAEKVPKQVYHLADYNLAVTNQPHSEVASLGIVLHELFSGEELEKEFEDAEIKVIPEKEEKNLRELE